MTNHPHPVEGQQALAERLRELAEMAGDERWFVSEDDRDGMEWNDHIYVEGTDNRVCFMARPGSIGPSPDQLKAKAALIVALRNAIPEILAALSPVDAGVADKFWRDAYDGVPMTGEQVRAELRDYHFLLEQIPLVYSHVTGGLLSKTNYHASAVNHAHDEYVQRLIDDEVKDQTEHLTTVLRSSSEQHRGDGGKRRVGEYLAALFDEFAVNPKGGRAAAAAYARCARLVREKLDAADTPAPEPTPPASAGMEAGERTADRMFDLAWQEFFHGKDGEIAFHNKLIKALSTARSEGAREMRSKVLGIVEALGDKDKNDMLVNEPTSFAAGYEIAAEEIAVAILALIPSPTGNEDETRG